MAKMVCTQEIGKKKFDTKNIGSEKKNYKR